MFEEIFRALISKKMNDGLSRAFPEFQNLKGSKLGKKQLKKISEDLAEAGILNPIKNASPEDKSKIALIFVSEFETAIEELRKVHSRTIRQILDEI